MAFMASNCRFPLGVPLLGLPTYIHEVFPDCFCVVGVTFKKQMKKMTIQAIQAAQAIQNHVC